MPSVATLICNPVKPVLDAATVARACKALPAAREPAWLDRGVAADIPFDSAQATGDVGNRYLGEAVRAALDGAPIDVVVQPAAGRRKKLFLADMDSTMIGQECIDELADYAGLKSYVSAITERAMRGEIDFEPALRERVALLEGIPLSVIDDVFEKRITLTPGGRTLVATMRANGAFTCLVSGGFTLFTNRVAAMIGFNETRANTLELAGDTLTGRVVEPIFGRESKLAALRELRAERSLKREETLVTGDGANDLAMIAEAGLGVAYHAKPKVAEAASARIDHGDLTALLYAQGYRRDEFVDA